MATAIRMPRWGMIMEEGTLLTWLKEEGETVEEGMGLAEVESEKVVNDLESPVTGILARVVVKEGDSVPVGALLAVIAEPGEGREAVDAIVEKEAASDTQGSAAGPATAAATAGATAGARPGKRISPAAKRLAEEKGLNWGNVNGSGPGGRVQIKDIQDAIEQSGTGEQSQPLSSLRQAIARRTTKSIEAPQAALCREIDLSDLLETKASQTARDDGEKVSLTAYVIKGVIRALEKVPLLNARLQGGALTISTSIHLGIVVSVEGGIMVPVIRDAQEKSLEEINAELGDLVKRAAERRLSAEELEGGTFTLSNAGGIGIDLFQPLLNPPEVAVLGIGQIKKRALVVENEIAVRSTAFFCLGTDHRAIDAGPASEFLRLLDEYL